MSANVNKRCDLLGMDLACVDSAGLVDHIFERLAHKEGGWVVTANLDFLRRHAHDPEARALYGAADLRVADGMPLVWAARIQGTPLPQRVAGSALVTLLAARAEKEDRSIYLLGGTEEINQRARDVWLASWPGLRVVGMKSPRFSSPPTPEEISAASADLTATAPDILLVGLGSPKQEQVIRALRPHLPATWMIGVGISMSFVAGDVRRAPALVQTVGLEWAWRLGQEPRRLARRYLIDDLPFAFELFASALGRRWRG